MHKSKATSTRVENAIKKAIKERARINFNSIATSANVSKSYLYNNKDFRVRIETLRRQQNEVKNVKSIKHNTSDKSKDTIIEALRHKVKELEKENKKLTGENKLLLGKLYDKL
ncbi:transposase [Bacillus sp. RIT809]|nr:transposase [Bacillus sp. RIT 809]